MKAFFLFPIRRYFNVMLFSLSVFVLVAVLVLAVIAIAPAFWGSPWHPLRRQSIKKILEFSELKAGENFFELGSGDGRVSLSAVQDFGAKATGFEIDPIKVWLARWLARRANVSESAQFFRKNFFETDCSDADVVYLYLTHQAMDRLLPELKKQLKPSARIVCYRFCFRGQAPDKINADNNLFLYRMGKGNAMNAYS